MQNQTNKTLRAFQTADNIPKLPESSNGDFDDLCRNKKYNIALYLRLSREDENEGESNSIRNQRDLLTQFVSNHSELSHCQILEFCDDGYSGTNFERPNVKKMLECVQNHNINCIVVKDFSRFGRSYIEVGDFLEQVFPFFGVRFISVNDNYDSNNSIGTTAGLDMAFRTLVYELYSRDISQKVKSGRTAKAKKGEHLCMLAPFGYAKSKEKKNKLIIDPEAAKVVKKIFFMAREGKSLTNIAQTLNYENILTPLMYRKKNKTDGGRGWNISGSTNYWTTANVKRIIADERYTGKHISGTKEKIDISSNKMRKVPKEDWIVVLDAHEAIISSEKFREAQKILKHTNKANSTSTKKGVLSGKLKCGYCNRSLIRQPQKTNNVYYYCETKRFAKGACCLESISEKNMMIPISTLLNIYTKLLLTNEINGIKKSGITANSIQKQIKTLQVKTDKLRIEKATAFEKYSNEKITKSDFIETNAKINNQINEITAKIACCKNESTKIISSGNSKNSLPLNIVTANAFIERINVFNNKRIEIIFSFSNEIKQSI